MLREFLTAKIHRAVVTAKDANYVGSITIDIDLLNSVGIQPWEKVQVVDINNGARFETYVIPGKVGYREIQVNGAAAKLVELGHRVIIMSYGMLRDDEIPYHHLKIAILDEKNRIVQLKNVNGPAANNG